VKRYEAGIEPSEDLTPEQTQFCDTTDYLLGGRLVLKKGRLDRFLFDGGYCSEYIPSGRKLQRPRDPSLWEAWAFAMTRHLDFYYYNQDHLGNVREVVDDKGKVQQVTNYYPFGVPYTDVSVETSPDFQPYKFNGKELDKMYGLDTYDYGARQYDPILARWDRIDPLAEKYYNVSPYVYCANNPIMLVDPDGRDWYSSLDSVGYNDGQIIWRTQIHYTSCTSQEQLADNSIKGTYLGKTVVVFDGFCDEQLGKDNTLDGPNSKHATATVYGAGGADDITQYTAFTMTSNFDKYGAIKDGIYDASYVGNNKPNHIPKPYVLEKGGPINTIDGNRYVGGYSKDQKNGIFIHRTNNNGTANGYVSVGCLLIKAQQMTKFEKHVGKTTFKVILRRK
jgi:RHS repeat-associated protein